VISTGGLSMRSRTWRMTNPTARPMATPTAMLRTKSPDAEASEKLPLTTATTATR
jgi:hypothetical protein